MLELPLGLRVDGLSVLARLGSRSWVSGPCRVFPDFANGLSGPDLESRPAANPTKLQWCPMTTKPDLSAGSRTAQPSAGRGDLVLPLIEEEARIEKREVRSDRVRVSTQTDLVEERIRESLHSDEVEVVRVPVDRGLEAGEAAPTIRTEGGVTIVPVLEEILVVEKRLVLKEELHITRKTTTDTVELPVTLRKQRAVVERMGSEDGSAPDTDRALDRD